MPIYLHLHSAAHVTPGISSSWMVVTIQPILCRTAELLRSFSEVALELGIVMDPADPKDVSRWHQNWAFSCTFLYVFACFSFNVYLRCNNPVSLLSYPATHWFLKWYRRFLCWVQFFVHFRDPHGSIESCSREPPTCGIRHIYIYIYRFTRYIQLLYIHMCTSAKFA